LPARAAYTAKEAFASFSFGSAFDVVGQAFKEGENLWENWNPRQTFLAGLSASMVSPLTKGGFWSGLGWSGAASSARVGVSEYISSGSSNVGQLASAGTTTALGILTAEHISNIYSKYLPGGLSNGSKGFVRDRKSTRLNSSHVKISYAVFC